MTDKTVSHAIERGIDFLFANRRFCANEPRLWEGFDLLLGPSDEWVKAYAACALSSRAHIRFVGCNHLLGANCCCKLLSS
jgi:hypothetical protein